MKTFILMAAYLTSSVVSSAAALSYGNIITGTPAWDRPFGLYQYGLSADGVGSGYSYAELIVDQTGTYRFISTATGGWDNLAFLYQNSFSATAQLTNIIAGNDDYNGQVGLSGFDATLSPDTNYFFVTAAYYASTTGYFTNTIAFVDTGDNSPTGTASLVQSAPEPASIGLLGAAIVAIGLFARKKAI